MKNNTIVIVLISIIVLTMTNAFVGEQPGEPLGESLKVVLNNFTAHEDSYRSRQAAVNFSQMLHIALTRRSPFK